MVETRPNACILTEPGKSRLFYFPEDTTMNWLHANKEASYLFEEYEIPLNCVFYPEDPGFIPGSFLQMKKELFSGKRYNEDMLDIHFREFLIKLSRSLLSDAAKTVCNSAERKKMEDLRLRMLSKPECDWTVESMANSVYLSPSRFHAVYKMLFGSSPMKDLINARIDAAKLLLMTDAQSTLAELAEKLGYKNPYHFIRQFKAVTGVTPGVYRKNNR